MIYVLAPKAYEVFANMPSGAVYTADANGLIYLINNSSSDQNALVSAGCQVLTANVNVYSPQIPSGGPVVAVVTSLGGSTTYNNGSNGVGATLTATSNGAFPTQDGVAVTVGQRVLIRTFNNFTGRNGIYTLTQVGDASHPFILTRATDSDEPSELAWQFVNVSGGTLYTNAWFLLPIPGGIVIGTTPLFYVQVM